MPSIKTGKPAEVNNYWLVLHGSKKVFAPISKNANTSVKRALLQGQEETEFVPKDTVLANYRKYTTVAVVRNPFDRLVSCYTYFTQTQPQYSKNFEFPVFFSFREFLEKACTTPDEVSNKHFRSQYNLLSQDGIFIPSVVIDFDNISEIGQHLPVKNLEHKHKTQHGEYRGYYDKKLRKLVEKRFAKDLNFFNYEW